MDTSDITYYLGGWKNKFTNFLGRISYEFYIVHGFIIIQLGQSFVFEKGGYIGAAIMIALAFVLTVSVAWMLYKLCAFVSSLVIE